MFYKCVENNNLYVVCNIVGSCAKITLFGLISLLKLTIQRAKISKHVEK